MKLILENWRNYMEEGKTSRKSAAGIKNSIETLTGQGGNEGGNPTGMKKVTDPLKGKEDRKDISAPPSAPGGLEEQEFGFDVDTGEEYLSPEDLQEEEIQDLAAKFNVEASVEVASDGKPAILVWHKDGDVSAYHDGEEMYQDLASRLEMSEAALDEKKKKACEPSKGKRFAKRVDGKCRSFGQKGQAKGGGDRIRPGTKKGDAYCARSAKIKKCKNPPCANALSRKKWKCRGSKSVAE